MAFHDMLDWRLGIAVLRAMQDPAYNAGLSLDLRNPVGLPPELAYHHRDSIRYARMLMEELTDAAGHLCNFDPLDENCNIAHLVARFHGGRATARIVIIHPLWETSAIGTVHDELRRIGLDNAIFIDTYNLARRFSECYREVVRRLSQM
jgi:hypothetical protein